MWLINIISNHFSYNCYNILITIFSIIIFELFLHSLCIVFYPKERSRPSRGCNALLSILYAWMYSPRYSVRVTYLVNIVSSRGIWRERARRDPTGTIRENISNILSTIETVRWSFNAWSLLADYSTFRYSYVNKPRQRHAGFPYLYPGW